MTRSAGKSNLVLIGMPGVGKSTVGVLLAKAAARHFLDTDVHIQAHEGRTLQAILAADGREAFCRLEERYTLALDLRGHVIATGGSVVYSDRAMRHLAAAGTVIWLRLPLAVLERRLSDVAWRGIVMSPGQTLAEVFAEREPLYAKWAELAVDTEGMKADEVAGAILGRLARPRDIRPPRV